MFAADRLKSWAARNARLFLLCFVFGLVAHMQLYTQHLTTPDGLWSGGAGSGRFFTGLWEISLGRWALVLFTWAKSGLCAPALVSAISLALLALGAVMLTDVTICGGGRALRTLSCFTIMACPFVSGMIAYYYCSDAYAFAFMAAVFGVCLQFIDLHNRVVQCGIGALAVAFSLGCYQTNLGVACVVTLIALIAHLLDEGRPVEESMREFARAVASVVVGAVIYLVMVKYTEVRYGVDLAAYKGGDSFGFEHIISSLADSVPGAYGMFIDLLLGHSCLGNYFGATNVNLFLIAFCVALLVFSILRLRADAPRVCSLAVCVALLPLAANSTTIILPDMGKPTAFMVGGFACCLVLPAVLASGVLEAGAFGGEVESSGDAAAGASVSGACDLGTHAEWRDALPEAKSAPLTKYASYGASVLRVLTCGALAVLAWAYALQSNADASIMAVSYEQATALANRVATVLEGDSNVQAGAEVAVIGSPEMGNYPNPSPFYGQGSEYSSWGMFWEEMKGCYGCWEQLFECGGIAADLNLCSYETWCSIADTEEFSSMSCYPDSGSVGVIGGVVVVKVSDVEGWV